MIVSRDNRRLKDMRRLRRCKDDPRALLEGPHLVLEACRAGVAIDYSLATPEFLAGPAAAPVLAALDAPPHPVAGRLLDELADADSPRGLVAAARLPTAELAGLPAALDRPLVFVDGLQDPGNLGALARASEAAGAAGLALAPGTVHPRHPRALRASAGSLLRLPTVRDVDVEDLRRRYPAPATRLAALVPRGGADLYRADLAGGLVVLLGAEGGGLSAAAEGAADLRLTVPLEAPVESLNSAVAAAVVLFEIRRRRAAAGRAADLSPSGLRAPPR